MSQSRKQGILLIFPPSIGDENCGRVEQIEMLQEIPPRVIDPNAIVAQFEKLFRGILGDRVSLRTDLDPKLGRIKANPRTIERVLMNLAVNVLNAMVRNELVIATSNVDLDRDAASALYVSPGSYIQIELSAIRRGVHTTPAIRNIVEQAHGAVSVRDTGMQGVTVTVLLPKTPREA